MGMRGKRSFSEYSAIISAIKGEHKVLLYQHFPSKHWVCVMLLLFVTNLDGIRSYPSMTQIISSGQMDDKRFKTSMQNAFKRISDRVSLRNIKSR